MFKLDTDSLFPVCLKIKSGTIPAATTMLLYFQYVQKIHTHVQKIIFVKKVRLNRKRKIIIVEEYWVAPFETKNWLRIQYLILTFSSSISFFLIRYFKNLSGHKCVEFRRKIGMCLYFITSYWHYVISFFVVWSFFIHTEKMILLIVKRIQWCTPQRRFGIIVIIIIKFCVSFCRCVIKIF